jgi:hypothetical protein
LASAARIEVLSWRAVCAIMRRFGRSPEGEQYHD